MSRYKINGLTHNIYRGIIKWKIEMIGERAASKKQQTGTYNGVSERNIYEIAKDLVCVKNVLD